MAARGPASAVERGRALQKSILDEASKVYEDTKRVQQLGLPMAMGAKSDQMLMPGFDVGGILDPRRTWRQAYVAVEAAENAIDISIKHGSGR